MTVKQQPLDSGSHFDVTKHIRLVPLFQEKEVDKYFLHFEKVAENLKWPKEHWTLLLQSVIIGKARFDNLFFFFHTFTTRTICYLFLLYLTRIPPVAFATLQFCL